MWNVKSWRAKPAKQQPDYTGRELELTEVENKLKQMPPLVDFEEIEKLKQNLKMVNEGKAFILQGGDCAEAFDALTEQSVKNYLRTILQMNLVLMYGLKKPVVRIGRIAGQFAKPRSSNIEVVDGVEYQAYRGDIVNDISLNNRAPNPQKMLDAYFNSTSKLNFIRSLTKSGFASLENVKKWNTNFVNFINEQSDIQNHDINNDKFTQMADEVCDYIDFIKACHYGTTPYFLNEADFFTSHEALLLNYEECFVKKSPVNGLCYNLSAHTIWIGDRTRGLNDAHVEFLKGLQNPIGIKVGPSANFDEVCEVIKVLNPQNESGKIIAIIRMGHDKITQKLPEFLKALSKNNLKPILQSDPMHGNIIKSENNFKTRRFGDILNEIESFFKITTQHQFYPGGIHLEMTGDNVTECTGGFENITEQDLAKRYHTHCDPRLNSNQSIELAFLICDLFSKVHI